MSRYTMNITIQEDENSIKKKILSAIFWICLVIVMFGISADMEYTVSAYSGVVNFIQPVTVYAADDQEKQNDGKDNQNSEIDFQDLNQVYELETQETQTETLLSVTAHWYEEIYRSLYKGITDFGKYSTINTVYEKVKALKFFDGLKATMTTLGISLVLIYFFLALSEEAMSKSLNVQSLFRNLVKLTVIAFIVAQADNIANYLFTIGDSIVSDTAVMEDKALVESGIDMNLFRKGLSKADEASIGYLLKAFLPYVLIILNNVFLTLVGLSRIIEFMFRLPFAPIALSDIYKNGASGQGMRFMKRFLAIGMQFAMISVISAIVAIVYTNMTKVFGATTAEDMLNILERDNYKPSDCVAFIDMMLHNELLARCALLFAKMVLTFKSLSLCNDIVGV